MTEAVLSCSYTMDNKCLFLYNSILIQHIFPLLWERSKPATHTCCPPLSIGCAVSLALVLPPHQTHKWSIADVLRVAPRFTKPELCPLLSFQWENGKRKALTRKDAGSVAWPARCLMYSRVPREVGSYPTRCSCALWARGGWGRGDWCGRESWWSSGDQQAGTAPGKTWPPVPASSIS